MPATPAEPEGLPYDLDAALAHYRAHGYARLGRLLNEPTLVGLRARIDALMLGEITYPGVFFQRDTETGEYDDLAYGRGYEGPSLNYRKVEKLEKDPLFRAWIEGDTARRVCDLVYHAPISIYRALVFNKAAETGGSDLPWHQDGGTFWGLDREPVLQIWTALDDAPEGGGCLEVWSGSHARGLVTPLGGVVPADHVAAEHPEQKSVLLPARAGEMILVHNHVWHRSGRSTTGKPRRALTVCYMDAATRCLRKKRAPRSFFRVFEREGP